MTTARITLPELEQYLAKPADVLLGNIYQADFKIRDNDIHEKALRYVREYY